jgi:hypothetical protein
MATSWLAETGRLVDGGWQDATEKQRDAHVVIRRQHQRRASIVPNHAFWGAEQTSDQATW